MAGSTEVLVVGGGSTGCGIARDLALRGVDVTLVEKGTLTNGTSGRMHGLLHSGARYAVSDTESARECIAENRVLTDVAKHCVEETGGLFVQLEGDPDDYFEEKLAGCRECDIPAEVLSGTEARAKEPHLSDQVKRAIAVPDAAIDPFRLCVANALDAERHGGTILPHTEVVAVHRTDGHVAGVTVDSTPPGERPSRFAIDTTHVVNATGAWAGQLGEMAGVDVDVIPSKGAMVVTNCRQLDTVVNRCRPKGDADIIVPHETTAILGTTDEVVSDPEEYPEEGWEVDLLIDELSELVPIIAEARTLRSFWGVRPLYEPPGTGTTDSTDVTRQFFILDHADRDDLAGFTTIVGGKLTTYRLMAEAVADHVCDRLGVSEPCETTDRPLPGSHDSSRLDDAMDRFDLRSPVARRSHERLGSRTMGVLESMSPNPVVCECEAVTRAEVHDAIDHSGPDLDAVRIRTRASMGNCQGGRCAHRLAFELHPQYDHETVTDALDSLYQERFKGERHALWGEQLSQAMLNHAIHAATMNRDAHAAQAGTTITFDDFDDGGTRRGD